MLRLFFCACRVLFDIVTAVFNLLAVVALLMFALTLTALLFVGSFIFFIWLFHLTLGSHGPMGFLMMFGLFWSIPLSMLVTGYLVYKVMDKMLELRVFSL